MSRRRPLPVTLAVTALAAGLAAAPTALAPVAAAATGDGSDGPATTRPTVWRSPTTCAFSYTAAGEIGNGHAGNENVFKASDPGTGVAAVQNFGLTDRSFAYRAWVRNYVVAATNHESTDFRVTYIVEHGPAGATYEAPKPIAVGEKPLQPSVAYGGSLPAGVTADANGRAEFAPIALGDILRTGPGTRGWKGPMLGFSITGTAPEGTKWESTGANVPYLTEYVTGRYEPLPGENSSCRKLAVAADDAGMPFDGATHKTGATVTNADAATTGYAGTVVDAAGAPVEGATVSVDPATGVISASVPEGTEGPLTVTITQTANDSYGNPKTVTLQKPFTLVHKPAPVLPDPTDPTNPGTGSLGGFGPGSLGSLGTSSLGALAAGSLGALTGSLGSLGSLGAPGSGQGTGSGSTPGTGTPGTGCTCHPGGSLGSLGSTGAPSGQPGQSGQGSQAGSSAGSASTAGSSTR